MKGLAGIRDAMWELLTNESTSHSWDVICQRLLEKPLFLWEDLMQQLFLDRLQVRRSLVIGHWSLVQLFSGQSSHDLLMSGGLLSSSECTLSLLTDSGMALLENKP